MGDELCLLTCPRQECLRAVRLGVPCHRSVLASSFPSSPVGTEEEVQHGETVGDLTPEATQLVGGDEEPNLGSVGSFPSWGGSKRGREVVEISLPHSNRDEVLCVSNSLRLLDGEQNFYFYRSPSLED